MTQEIATIQDEVVRLIGARGYLEGYDDEEILARQICKAGEELAEMALAVAVPRGNWYPSLLAAGAACKKAFDNGRVGYVPPSLLPVVLKEAPDLRVVEFVIWHYAGKMHQASLDFDQLALQKVRADVDRGVRRR